jgi:rRNA maturation protein Rpf1
MLLSLRRFLFILIVITTASLFSVLLSSFYPHITAQRPNRQETHQRRLLLLLPINERAARASWSFCTTIMSAIVHGYDPIIINWDADGNSTFLQISKVSGTSVFTLYPANTA